jgi:hypothetical protein
MSANTSSNFRLPQLAAAVALALGAMFALPAGAGGAASDAIVARPTVDVEYALVQLNGEPLATYSKTKPPQG